MLPDGCGKGSLECVGRLSIGFGKVVWRVWKDCFEGVGRLCDRSGEAVWRVWKGCMVGIGRLSAG